MTNKEMLINELEWFDTIPVFDQGDIFEFRMVFDLEISSKLNLSEDEKEWYHQQIDMLYHHPNFRYSMDYFEEMGF